MLRKDMRALVALHARAREIKGRWGEWALMAIGVIACLAPAIRIRQRKKLREEIVRDMVWTVGQCLLAGDYEFSEDDLRSYTHEQLRGFMLSLDAVIVEALTIFGVKDYILPTLDAWQDEPDGFYAKEAWPKVREWLETALA